jgi:hypothetical protein
MGQKIIQKFYAIYLALFLITVCKTVCWQLCLSTARTICYTPTHPSYMIHFCINLSSMSRSFDWSLLFRCFYSNPVHISHTCSSSTQPITLHLLIQIFGKQLEHGVPNYEIVYFFCFLQLRPKFLS